MDQHRDNSHWDGDTSHYFPHLDDAQDVLVRIKFWYHSYVHVLNLINGSQGRMGTPCITFTDDPFATVEDSGLYTDLPYQGPLWSSDLNDSRPENSLLLTPASSSVCLSTPSESPSTADSPYFPSSFSSPCIPSNRKFPQIRLEIPTLPSLDPHFASIPPLSPPYRGAHLPSAPSSALSSGGASSIALPTPAASPHLVDNLNMSLGRVSMSSASPVSPFMAESSGVRYAFSYNALAVDSQAARFLLLSALLNWLRWRRGQGKAPSCHR